MKTIATVITAATFVVASTAASAWGRGPFGNRCRGVSVEPYLVELDRVCR